MSSDDRRVVNVQLIAVDDQSDYPPEAPTTDLSAYEPNVEAIAGYEPDLVIAAYDPGGLVDGLEKLDIPVLLQDAAPMAQFMGTPQTALPAPSRAGAAPRCRRSAGRRWRA